MLLVITNKEQINIFHYYNYLFDLINLIILILTNQIYQFIFYSICNELTSGILSTVYNDGMKTFKKHEHLLAIKQYNKPSTNLVIDMVSTGRLDPFTRQPITKPVTNKVCKHIYDQDSVSLMFQGKHFICCPYIGCTNKHFTKKDILCDLNTSNTSE